MLCCSRNCWLMFLLLLRLEDDFFFDEKRILLRVDRSAKKG